MDILEFYGLKEDPFRLTPDPMFYYPSAVHNEALLSMDYVVEQKEGFCLITGEPGTGKTTLINVFKENWKDKAEIALILTPRLSSEEFLVSVLEDFKIKLSSSNKNDILKAFRDFLIEKSQIEKPVIIIVDEAQNLPDETLEELRLLSNLESYKDKLLQIFLVGQLELERRLLQENLKQLNQRITVRIRLSPLEPNETLDYINYRLIKAGKGFLKIGEGLQKPIYNFSAGIPRIINIISSRAIMSSYLEGSNTVNANHVKYAIKHFEDLASIKQKKSFRNINLLYALISLCFLVLAAIGGYYYFFIKAKSQEVTKDIVVAGERDPMKIAVTTGDNAIKTETLNDFKKREIKAIESQNRKTVTVIVNSANLRASPSLDAEPISWVSRGVTFEIKDEFTEATDKKWYKVQTSQGRECWIADKAVEVR